MRPIKLELEGFTSFRQNVSIDFRNFSLFAITGPTGAGKTSIIDAIIYALYGCTPRLGKTAISKLISQGADRLKVLFEFSSGKLTYRVARQTKRSAKSTVTDVRLEERQSDKWAPLADKVGDADRLIEKLVGLDFNGFTKSVVLPQGRFDEFLKGEPKERRQILSDLLGLDVYVRMMQRANDIAKENGSKAQIIGDLLKRDYAGATPESREVLVQDLNKLKPLLGPLESDLDRVSKSIPAAHLLRRNRAELRQATIELLEVGPQLSKSERALAAVQSAIADLQSKTRSVNDAIQANQYNSDLHLRLSATIEKAEHLRSTEKRALDLEQALRKKTSEIDSAQAKQKEVDVLLQEATETRIALQKEIESDKKKLETALKRYGSSDAIQALIEVNQQRIKSEQKQSAIEEALTELEKKHRRRSSEIKEIDGELAAANQSLQQTRTDLDSLRRQHAAEELKQALVENQPCPVCEQIVPHLPRRRKHPSVDRAEASAAKYENEVTRLEKRKSAAEAEIEQLTQRIEDHRKQIEDIKTAVGTAANQIRAVLKKAPGIDTESALIGLRDSAQLLQDKVEDCMGRLERLRDAESRAASVAGDNSRKLSVLQAEVAGISREMDRSRADIDRLRKDLGSHADVKLVKGELARQEQLKSDKERLENDRESLAGAMSQAKDELAAEIKTVEGLKTRRISIQAACDKLRSNVEQACTALGSNFPDLDLAAEEENSDPAAQLENRLRELQSERDVLQSKIREREQAITTVEQQIERAAKMQEELREHREQSALANELGHALQGNQFIAFVQQEAYHRLAADGSVHLSRLSSDRYSFGVDKDDFVVLDHWNADEARPVTTLSGGESFLASLALALALAEGLSGLSHSRGRIALESLFLDEGFGTLDAETLDVVLQGVENLSTSDRVVGIVSHLIELAERMPARIHVRKAIGGSSIEVS